MASGASDSCSPWSFSPGSGTPVSLPSLGSMTSLSVCLLSRRYFWLQSWLQMPPTRSAAKTQLDSGPHMGESGRFWLCNTRESSVLPMLDHSSGDVSLDCWSLLLLGLSQHFFR